jgi:hypothetical protein
MGAAAGILADRIAAFAQALEDAGADAQFIGITTGDAFATKAISSSFTDIAKGSLGEPPLFDFDERPDTGASLLSAGVMADFFTEVRAEVGSGAGGGDLPENYLGPLVYINDEDNVNWRPTASRVLISIGDDCSHTAESAPLAGITGDWIPPSTAGGSPENLFSGVVVHVIGSDPLSCPDPYYDMKDLATATGGQFVVLGDCGSDATCNVDLSELSITTSITESARIDCDGTETEGDDLATVCFDVSADGGDASFCAVLALVEK